MCSSDLSNDIQPAFYFDKNSNIIEYVYFNYNSANINQLGCRQLSNLATFLQENSIVTIAITCSYDSSDETEYNKMLSKRRANNVRLYLLGKGIVGERVRINALVDVKSNQSNEVYHYNQEILEKQRRAELEISWSKK